MVQFEFLCGNKKILIRAKDKLEAFAKMRKAGYTDFTLIRTL